MAVLVLGANGQVGRALCAQLGDDAIAATRKQVDLSEDDVDKQITAFLGDQAVEAIINAAAYTAVDQAEDELKEAMQINSQAVEEIARWAFERGVPLVHYSTDYVFSGEGEAPWSEDDKPAPINMYGASKVGGERAIAREAEEADNARWLIFRTSWVYDEAGKNFFNTMLHLGEDREVISVVADQFGAPTYAHDIADLTLQALDRVKDSDVFPSGIYHLCNGGETNWHGFAEAIFREASDKSVALAVKDVKEITTAEFPTDAQRPLNSRMDCGKFRQIFGLDIPDWQDALARCVATRFGV